MSSIIKKGDGNALANAIKSASTKQTVSATENLMICIDGSGSMRDRDGGKITRMEAAIEASDALINASSYLSHIGALVFHDFAAEVLGCETQRHLLRERLRGFVRHEGGTVFCHAIHNARLSLLNHKWGTIRRIIFLSDGEDIGDLLELRKQIDACAAEKIIVDTVAYGAGAGHETLQWMSNATGGVFVLAKDAASLRKQFLALEAGARGLLPKGK